jgi:hypothetical protein
MACGGCGGSKGGKRLRAQPVRRESRKPQKTVKVQRVKRRNNNKSVNITRQYVVPHARCPKCGYPSMLVNIGGRERHQCSNANCRYIIR